MRCGPPDRTAYALLARSAALIFLIASVTGYASTSRPEPLEVSEIASGVFVHRGAHAGLEDPARADSANIGFIVGATCVAVIDTGGSVEVGARLLAALRAQTTLPVCYVINTHGHFDHVLGNAAFVVEQPKFVGHANLASAIAASRDYFAENFSVELGNQVIDAVVGPDTLISAVAHFASSPIRWRIRSPILRWSTNTRTRCGVAIYCSWNACRWSTARLQDGWLGWRRRRKNLMREWSQVMDQSVRRGPQRWRRSAIT
jgi:hypothetical protein